MNWRSNIFRSYLLSMTGIFIITLGLISMFSAWKIVGNLQAEERRVVENKLYSVADDLQNQIKVLSDTAITISMRPEFREVYFGESKSKEIDMLERLEAYQSVSELPEYYFIKYLNKNNIFGSDCSTMSVSYFLSDYLKSSEPEALKTIFDEVCLGVGSPFRLVQQENKILLVYSMKHYGILYSDHNAAICFVLSQERVKNRINSIVGTMNGQLRVDFEDVCLYRDEGLDDGDIVDNSEVISFEQGPVTIYYIPNESHFSLNAIISQKELVLVIAFAIFVLGVSTLIAYANVEPIRRITEKYKDSSDVNLRPEWESISSFIESLLRNKEEDSATIEKQYQMLREQIIHLIVTGNYTSKIDKYMLLLNISISEVFFGLLRFRFMELDSQVTDDTEKQLEKLYHDIGCLTGNGLQFYPCYRSNGDLSVLITMEEEYQLEEATDLIMAVFEEMNLSTTVMKKEVYRSLTELTESFEVEDKPKSQKKRSKTEKAVKPAAKELLQTEEDILSSEMEAPKAANIQNNIVSQAMDYVEKHYTEYSLSLDVVAEKLNVNASYLSLMIKQEIGCGYKDYLIKLRIKEAKRLLTEPNITVAEVCQRIGYNTSVPYFIRIFQQHTGMTPAKFRDGCKEEK